MAQARSDRRRNAIVFCCVAAAWLALDLVVKAWAEGFERGALLAPGLPGVFDLRLVHNTGGAWGLFGDMTAALGVVSLLVCAAIVAYLFWLAPDTPMAGAVGLALVFAGGIGNAIDRFLRGYVVDMIEPTFIDFPVFNVADIGVTCGIVLFVAALVAQGMRERKGSGDAGLAQEGDAPSGQSAGCASGPREGSGS